MLVHSLGTALNGVRPSAPKISCFVCHPEPGVTRTINLSGMSAAVDADRNRVVDFAHQDQLGVRVSMNWQSGIPGNPNDYVT